MATLPLAFTSEETKAMLLNVMHKRCVMLFEIMLFQNKPRDPKVNFTFTNFDSLNLRGKSGANKTGKKKNMLA